MRNWWLALVLGGGWLSASWPAHAQGPGPALPPPSAPLPAPAGPAPVPGWPLTDGAASVPPPGVPPLPAPGAAIPLPPPDAPSPPAPAPPPDNPMGTWAHGSVVPERFYVNLEYLGWFVRKLDTPILVTSGAFNDQVPGALGQPGTQPLIQGSNMDGHTFLNGGRLTLGYDLVGDESWSVLGSAFILEQRGGHLATRSDGAPGSAVLARPFFNANAGLPDADPIAVPGVMAGAISVDTPRLFYGADANIRGLYLAGDLHRFFFLAGARFLSLDEKLLINESIQDIPGLGAPGISGGLSENFTTRNRFYGGQVGAQWESHFGPVFLNVIGKFGLGPTFQTLNTGAFTQITQNGVPSAAFNHALLVQPSNAGHFTREQFSFVPELGINLSVALNQRIRLGGGYNFIYWTQVLRPDKVIDPTVNVQALQPFDQVGPARPAPLMQSSNFWAQGFTLSLELCF